MRNKSLLAICASFFLIAAVASSQEVHGSTTMQVDSTTSIVTATCETDVDSDYYASIVDCTVRDGNGNQIADGYMVDQNGYEGYAQAVVTFTGSKGITYIATGTHSAIPTIPFDEPEDPHGRPVQQFYYDLYNFSSFAEGGPQTYFGSYDWYGPGPEIQVKKTPIHIGDTTAQATVPVGCPTTVTIASIIPASLPSVDLPGALTGVGILSRMLVAPLAADYTGQSIQELITPVSNSCPSNIASYTGYPNAVTSFTVGLNTSFEGIPFPSFLNSFYDQHVNDLGVDILSATSVSTCTATALQVYSCGGNPIGSFSLSKTFTHGTLSGVGVTNVLVTKH